MRRGLVLALCAVVLLPAPPALGATEEDDASVLAEVGGETITVAEFEAEMERRGRRLPGQYEEPADRRFLLEEMVRQRQLVAAARGAGYETRTDLVRAFEQMMAAQFQEEQLEAATHTAAVSDEEVLAWYEGNAERYTVPAKIQAALIRVDLAPGLPEGKEQERRARAQQALEAARQLPPEIPGFGALAQQYSDDTASRYVGGAVGWLSQGRSYRWPQPVVDALFALESPGAVDGVLEAGGALWIVRLMQRQEAKLRPLETVEDGIRHELVRLQRQRERERLFRKLAATFPVRIDEDRLAQVGPPSIEDPSKSPPPPVPARPPATEPGSGSGDRP